MATASGLVVQAEEVALQQQQPPHAVDGTPVVSLAGAESSGRR